MEDTQDPELLAEFVSESLRGLQDIEQDLLSLEGDGTGDVDTDLVNRIFRAVHSIKGSGSFLGLENLVRVAHRGETLLDQLRSGQKKPSPDITDAVLAANDALIQMLEAEDLGTSFDSEGVLVKLDVVLGGGRSQTATSSTSQGSDKSNGALTKEDLEIIRGKAEPVVPIYQMHVELAKLHHSIDTKEGILEGLNSIGKVLHASIPIDQIEGTMEGECAIYYQTVLEVELLSAHFGIPADRLKRLDLDAAATEVASVPKVDPSPKTAAAPKHAEAALPTDDHHSAAHAGARGEDAGSDKKSANSPAATNSKAAAAKDDQTMRVPVRILHELLEWTGNMVMARNQLMNEFDFAGSTAFHTLSQAITGVHETVIETRMQNTGTLFERYRRVVRDLGRQLQKEVAFHIEGGDLELDRTILESFADPLTHLVRNCMDHALEPPQEREAAGKNRQGNVYLRSYVQSGEIILEVEDDGRGIPAQRVCDKAVEKGVITAEQAANLTDQQKVMLIFEPGFSTKDQATDVSGRGVGMDVVKNNIERVGGSIEVRTKLGEGSIFSAHLPLAKALVSSSLTSALIIEVEGEKFAIPETAVSEIIRCDKRALDAIHRVDGRKVYQLRDGLVALIDLYTALEIPEERMATTEGRGSEAETRCLVVLQYRNHLFGTIVDNVLGIQEIIVRSTPRLLENCTVYSGHTILGDGRVSLILDVNGIVNKLELEFLDKDSHGLALNLSNAKTSRSALVNKDDEASNTQKMLLFNYSQHEYFAVPLELIALIERITVRDIKRVGENEFCQFKNETVSIMRLENFLPITKLPATQKDFCLIRPAAIEYPIGILTGMDMFVLDVKDTFETRLDDSHGVVGTFVHDDRLVMMLDLFSVFEKHVPEKMRAREEEVQHAKILIAEDSMFFRKLIYQYIRVPEWDVEIVNDGLEAWERLQSEPNRFDLVISDINMPRMDGFELAVKIREDRRFDKLPLVALTTMSEEHFKEKGLRCGFDRYVIKIDKREVRSTVAECLRIKRKK
jgi:two-component system, chemotaxis family, sensor kinase CheA